MIEATFWMYDSWVDALGQANALARSTSRRHRVCRGGHLWFVYSTSRPARRGVR